MSSSRISVGNDLNTENQQRRSRAMVCSPGAADSGEQEDLTAECRGREGDGGKCANIWLSGSGPTLRC